MTSPETLPQPKDGTELRKLARSMAERNPDSGGFHLLGSCHREFEPVAYWPATSEEGASVRIDAACLPAIFYRLTPQIEGAASWTTGSGVEVADLIVQMAKAIAESMLGQEGLRT